MLLDTQDLQGTCDTFTPPVQPRTRTRKSSIHAFKDENVRVSVTSNTSTAAKRHTKPLNAYDPGETWALTRGRVPEKRLGHRSVHFLARCIPNVEFHVAHLGFAGGTVGNWDGDAFTAECRACFARKSELLTRYGAQNR